MKKKGILLSVLLVFCMLLSPLGVHAAQGAIFGSADSAMTQTTLNGNEVSLVYTEGQRPVIYLGVILESVEASHGGPMKEYNAELTLENSNFTFSGSESDVRLASGWEGTITNKGNGVISINLKRTDDGLTTTGRNVRVANITLDVSSSASNNDTCKIVLKQVDGSVPSTPTENPKCQVKDDKYYCENGVECTKEEYDAKCTTSTENPKTGSFMPYAVIIAGVAVAGGLYFLTKKNKIYHM